MIIKTDTPNGMKGYDFLLKKIKGIGELEIMGSIKLKTYTMSPEKNIQTEVLREQLMSSLPTTNVTRAFKKLDESLGFAEAQRQKAELFSSCLVELLNSPSERKIEDNGVYAYLYDSVEKMGTNNPYLFPGAVNRSQEKYQHYDIYDFEGCLIADVGILPEHKEAMDQAIQDTILILSEQKFDMNKIFKMDGPGPGPGLGPGPGKG